PSPVPERFLANWLAPSQWLNKNPCEGSTSYDCDPPLPRFSTVPHKEFAGIGGREHKGRISG
ncbi:MAG: hypothetical protein ACK43N_09795, partial [Pirellulaceae bacterium]